MQKMMIIINRIIFFLNVLVYYLRAYIIIMLFNFLENFDKVTLRVTKEFTFYLGIVL